MYFNQKNSFYHGVMFHHFHDNKKHIKSQGSINKSMLIKLINFIGRKNIIDADEFLKKFQRNELKKNHVCLTFDDSLKCQFDIAKPVLDKFNIKAFFFVYTASLENELNYIEIFRYFRSKFYKNINIFYKDFFSYLEKKYSKAKVDNFFKKNRYERIKWKKKFKFYSNQDINFRLIRNKFFSDKDYLKIMLGLIKEKGLDINKLKNKFNLNKKEILRLHKSGHLIGLHTHSHPFQLNKLNYSIQKREYQINKKILEKITKTKILSVAHPCGSYNKNTLKILNSLGVEIGFKQIMTKESFMKKINNSKFEIAREDHSKIVSKLK
tara:strand:- start:2026 stop:2994 length:969 start_codon:yes stop_codon:yes gene_type:complete